MKRQYLPIDALPAWARLNDISFHGVEVKRVLTEDGVDKGSAVIATRTKVGKDLSSDVESQTLMRIPSDLILSLERVEMYAKSDKYLREVLDAVGEFGMTARGAILIYLLLLITHSSLQLSEHKDGHRDHVGVSSPWTEYIKFLPESFDIPTFYTPEEYELLRGTSLEPALDSKMDSLGREFELLRRSTEDIPWCKRDWWGEEGTDIGSKLSFADWKTVDAMYRSRALELPGKGHSMVPCVDMANHASGEGTGAVFEIDADGNTILQLRWGQRLDVGEEVTITYGDEKGASEMIFSYGFLEDNITDPRQLFLDLHIPGDDPLKPAKKAVCKDAPGVRLFVIPDSPQSKTDWESDYVWWICINEEDGLDFCVLQSNDGERELKVFWKEKEIDTSHTLRDMLMKDPMWDVFQLRAIVTVQERVSHQLALLRASQEGVEELAADADESVIRKPILDSTMRLRNLEDGFLARSSRDLEEKKMELFNSPTVKAYLGSHGPGADISEDFS